MRDQGELKAEAVGIKALASHPKKSEKRDLGTYDEVLEFSGVTIRPGDYIYADEDGVVIAETALSV